MNKYGQAALRAVELIELRTTSNPIEAWEMATGEIFGIGTASQVKGCPKSTFLALCESGKVKGVEPSKYTKSIKNKEYALKALGLLQTNPALVQEPKTLWNSVQGNNPKIHNSQMDVVATLWSNGLIQ